MGSGKTYIALKIAQEKKMNLFVICPKSVVSNWEKLAQEFGIKIHFCTTYQSFRGMKKKKQIKINHPYLRSIYGSEYSVTEEFEKISKENDILFVFDEFQHLKNVTNQWRSIYAITKYIKNKPKHKMAFLSSTPFDKEKSVKNLIILTGLASDPLLSAGRYHYDLLGASEFIKNCSVIDYETTYNIYNPSTRLVSGEFTKLLYDLYIKIIVPKFVFIMNPPVIESKLDIKNGRYGLDEYSKNKIRKGMDELTRCVRSINNKGEMNLDISIGLGSSLSLLEEGKINILKKLIGESLQMKNSKVIVFASYNNTINKLSSHFTSFNPLILNGSCTLKKRKAVIDGFQEHSLKNRLLISNTKVGGTGVDLHDTHGMYPRFIFLLPNFNMIDIHQACGRTYRIGTKSDSFIRIIYTDENEQRLIESIQKKSKILRETTDEDILYIGDYKTIENDHSFLEVERLKYKEMFNETMSELKYLPGFSLEFNKAQTHFYGIQ